MNPQHTFGDFTYDIWLQRHQELIDSAEQARLARTSRRARLFGRSRNH